MRVADLFFFFQAEDGIRDLIVTGVQTCALPILATWVTYREPKSKVQSPGKRIDRKSTRLNSSHDQISYAVFCLKKKQTKNHLSAPVPLPIINIHMRAVSWPE